MFFHFFMNIYSFCFLLTPILQQKYSLQTYFFANNYTIQLIYKLYRCFYDIIFAISMPNLYAINEGIPLHRSYWSSNFIPFRKENQSGIACILKHSLTVNLLGGRIPNLSYSSFFLIS